MSSAKLLFNPYLDLKTKTTRLNKIVPKLDGGFLKKFYFVLTELKRKCNNYIRKQYSVLKRTALLF